LAYAIFAPEKNEPYRIICPHAHWLLWKVNMSEKPTYQALEERIAQLEAQLQACQKTRLPRPRQFDAISTDAGSPLLFSIINNAQTIIHVKDTDGRFILVNRSFCEIFRLQEKEVLGRTPFELFPHDIAAQHLENDKHIIHSKTPSTYNEQAVLPDGRHEYISVKFPIFGDTGSVVAVGCISTDITERFRTEEKLRQSEDRFRLAFITSPDAINLNRMGDGLYLDINEGFTTSMGYTREDVIGNTSIKLNIWKNAADRKRLIEGLQKTGFVKNLEARFIRKDGQIAVGLMSARILRINDEDVILSITRDITEWKLAEEALRESEGKYRTLVENASEAIFIAQEGMLRFVNKKTEELSGYTTEELISIPFHTLIHAEDRGAIQERYTQRLQGIAVSPNFAFRVIHKSGVVRWVELNAVLVDWHGKAATLNFLHDITDRKRAEEAIEKRILALTMPLDDAASINFEDLFNLDDIQRLQDEFAGATGVASIITQTDGTPITRPSNFCRLCNDIIRKTDKGRGNCYKSDALIGRLSPEGPIIQPCMSGGLWDAGAAISVGGKHIANWLIGQVRNDTQTEKKILEYARDIGADEQVAVEAFREVPGMSRDRFGKVAQALFTLANQLSTSAYQNVQQARFISERRRDEKEKARMEDQYRQAQKVEAIGRLAGGVAHDLNNILTPIIGYSELLLDDFSPDDKRRENINQILRAGYGARDLVRQLLSFSRKQTLKYEPLNLNKTIKDFEKLLRRTIREDIRLEIIPSPDIRTVKGDIGQIEQVIMNLAVNAQDAMPDGGRLILETSMVELDGKYVSDQTNTLSGSYVMLAVSDTGCGMDEETRERIFDPFFSTKGEQGTGLGLSTVYGIVKQHEGHIWVYSEPGKGTTFKVYLPVADQTLVTMKADEKAGTRIKGSETILLVEDNEQVRHLTSDILRRQGYRLIVAGSGVEAVNLLASHEGPVALVLTDVVMPDMNGRELFAKIAEKKPGIRVLYMSGYTNDVIAHRGILDEGVQFIQKPFTIQGLATKIREVLTQA
jgi:PAS domain S-box-containing protein